MRGRSSLKRVLTCLTAAAALAAPWMASAQLSGVGPYQYTQGPIMHSVPALGQYVGYVGTRGLVT